MGDEAARSQSFALTLSVKKSQESEILQLCSCRMGGFTDLAFNDPFRAKRGVSHSGRRLDRGLRGCYQNTSCAGGRKS